MSKAGLKAAMDSLQVKTPLRVSHAAPAFIPPTPPVSREDTWAEKPTQVDLDTGVGFLAQGTISTQVGNHPQVTNSTGAENTTEVIIPTQAEKHTPVTKPTQVGKATQVSSITFESRASEKLDRGYTRLPNTILMRLASGDFAKNEIKLALLIARFTTGYQRALAPLSKAVLERQSGLRGSAVLEAIAGLVTKGLITKEQGDQYRPNQLGLVLPDDWDSLTQGAAQSEKVTDTWVGNPTQGSKPTGGLKPTPVEKVTYTPVTKPAHTLAQNPAYLKESLIKPKERARALDNSVDSLRVYFDSITAKRGREKELTAFRELREVHSEEVIAACLDWVRENGLPDSGESCFAPMAYLATAIDRVIARVSEAQRLRIATFEKESAQAEKQRLAEVAESVEELEWRKKAGAFSRAFLGTDSQESVIAQTTRALGIKASGEMARNLTISAWWDRLSPLERENLTSEA